MQSKLFFLHALSPLHAGTGQGLGVIDLPIAREKATGIPIVPGSTIKGVLRDAAKCAKNSNVITVFGPETAKAGVHAGSAQFTDMRLVLLPVRSLKGTFAWVTSPLLLRRLQRDAKHASGTKPPATVPAPAAADACITTNASILTLSKSNQVVLEDLELNATSDDNADTWSQWLATHIFDGDADWTQTLGQHLCIVHDDVLSFLLQTATEVTARIRLDDETKTVQKGALWYEEALPAETIMAGLVIAAQVKADPQTVFSTIDNVTQKPIQVGGNATVGRGLCQLRLV
jgi:CRISPR-associated protein Cmr4